MSLRDQLLKAGLASKKDARRADQQKRKAERVEAGNLDRKAQREARKAEKRAARAAAELQERAAQRRDREALRDRHEHALRIRQIIRAHELKGSGPVVFHHRDVSGSRLLRMKLSPGTASALTRGSLAIAAEDMGNRFRYAVVSEVGAAKLRELAPEVLVVGGEGEIAAEKVDKGRDWEPDLRARKATAEDIARLRAAAGTRSGL